MSDTPFPSTLLALTSREALERVAALPGFAQAAWRAIGLEIEGRRADPAFIKASDDIGLYMALALALHLHDTPGGLTHAGLTEALRRVDMASRGRARKLLLHLTEAGYIAPLPPGDDRREQRHAPTPARRRG